MKIGKRLGTMIGASMAAVILGMGSATAGTVSWQAYFWTNSDTHCTSPSVLVDGNVWIAVCDQLANSGHTSYARVRIHSNGNHTIQVTSYLNINNSGPTNAQTICANTSFGSGTELECTDTGAQAVCFGGYSQTQMYLTIDGASIWDAAKSDWRWFSPSVYCT